MINRRTSSLRFVAVILFATALVIAWSKSPVWPAAWKAAEDVERPLTFLIWPLTVEERAKTGSFTRKISERRILYLEGLAGETLTAQLGLRATIDIPRIRFSASDVGDLVSGRYFHGKTIDFRFGQYLPVDETGEMTADPLVPGPNAAAPGFVTVPVWVTIPLPSDLPPGRYVGGIEAVSETEAHYVHLDIELLDAKLPPAGERSSQLVLGLDPFALARSYGVTPFSGKHLGWIEALAREASSRGAVSITLPLVAERTGLAGSPGDTDTMVQASCPGEWPGSGELVFDFKRFDACFGAVQRGGLASVRLDIDSNLLRSRTVMTYRDTSGDRMRGIDLARTPDLYLRYLSRLLTDLEKHLSDNGWLEDGELLLFESRPDLAPTLDKLTTVVTLGTPLARDNPPATHLTTTLDEARRWCWTTFLPAAESQPASRPATRLWLNRWPPGVLQQPGGASPSGASFLFYPGRDVPMRSMRWEMILQGMQDVAAYRLAFSTAQAIYREQGRTQELLDLADRLRGIADRVRDGKLGAGRGRTAINAVLKALAETRTRDSK